MLNAALGQQQATTDALLQAAMKSDIPITLHLQYPLQQGAAAAAAAAGMPQQLATAAGATVTLQVNKKCSIDRT